MGKMAPLKIKKYKSIDSKLYDHHLTEKLDHHPGFDVRGLDRLLSAVTEPHLRSCCQAMSAWSPVADGGFHPFLGRLRALGCYANIAG